MARTDKPKSQQGPSSTMFEIMQYADFLTEEMIKSAIETHPCIRWCYILHDKDINALDGTLKKPHWHIFIKMASNYYAGSVAEWFGVEMQYVCLIKSKRYEKGVLYCIHKHDKSKYQYPIEEVKCNFDYKALVEADDTKNNNAERQKAIVEGIMDGTIRQFNFFDYVTAWEYNKYKSLIDKTFEYRLRKISHEHRTKEVIFIEGDAGVGKTSYAKKLAKDKGLSFCVSGASNDPLEDYMGEDVLILDDLRGSSQRLEDLLKMLDNHTSSTVKARYHNKVLECQMIIITTSQDINSFFKNVFADAPENVVQLKRRCKTYLQMSRDEILVSMYDEGLRDYFPVAHIENPMCKEHPVEELTQEMIDNRLNYLFGENIKKIGAPDTSSTDTPKNDIIGFTDNIVADTKTESNEQKDLFEFF